MSDEERAAWALIAEAARDFGHRLADIANTLPPGSPARGFCEVEPIVLGQRMRGWRK